MKICYHCTDLASVNDALTIYRSNLGKPTERHHYQNEVKLLRFALTGQSKSKIDFAVVKIEQPFLLSHVLWFEIKLIKRGIPFKDRKRRCRAMVLKRQAEESPFK